MFDDLFTLEELAAYLQVPADSLDEATVELLRNLAGTDIVNLIGEARFLARGAAAFKGCALAHAKADYTNPSGLRSRTHSIDDYSETDVYATETTTGVDRDSFEACVRRAAGLSRAFSIAIIDDRR